MRTEEKGARCGNCLAPASLFYCGDLRFCADCTRLRLAHREEELELRRRRAETTKEN